MTLPRAQGLRWATQTASAGRARTASLPSFSRNYSSLRLQSARLHSRRPLLHSQKPILLSQQCRSISWTGWWTGKTPTPAERTISSEISSSNSVVEPERSFQASHATADTPDPSILHGGTAEQIQPEILSKVEDAFLAPSDKLPDVIDISQIPERIGYLKEVCGLEYWYGTTAPIQWTIEHLHIWGAMPWSVAILCTALIARAISLRFVLKGQRTASRMREIKPEIEQFQERLRNSTRRRDHQETQVVRAEMMALMRSANVRYRDMFLPMFIQIPIAFGGFRCLRNASELPVPSMETESFLWVDSLTVSDPYILPLFVGALTWRSMRRSADIASPQMAQMMQFLKLALPVISVVFCHYQMLAVQLWFATQSIFAWIQISLLNNQRFRDHFDLGPIPKPPHADEPKIDAFGYRMKSEVGGMNLRNSDTVIDIPMRHAETQPEQPKQDISAIDKGVDYMKSKWKTGALAEANKMMSNRQKRKEKERADFDLDQYEDTARQDAKSERNAQKARSSPKKDTTEYVEGQVGGMKTRSRR